MSAQEAADRPVTVEAALERVDAVHAHLEQLLADPLIRATLSPAREELRFRYGDSDMVVVGVDRAGLALVARALRLARVRRHGRRGSRTWEIEPRPAAELPKPPFPVKGRHSRQR